MDITKLPIEVFMMVLDKLPYQFVVLVCRLVCKKFDGVSKDFLTWVAKRTAKELWASKLQVEAKLRVYTSYEEYRLLDENWMFVHKLRRELVSVMEELYRLLKDEPNKDIQERPFLSGKVRNLYLIV